MSRILFVMTHSPGTINAQEGFDALLMGSAFANCSALFLGQGLYQLINSQNREPIGGKNYTLGFAALHDYGVQNIYGSRSQLEDTVLSPDDFCINVELLADDEVNRLFDSHDTILTF